MNSTSHPQNLDSIRFRCEIYGILSKIFFEPPNNEIIKLLRDKSFKNGLFEYFGNKEEKENFDSIFSDMIKAFDQEPTDKLITDLSVEFTQLLMNPNPRYVLPYESHHHLEESSPAGFIHSSDVLEMYNGAGYVLSEKNTEIADYIGNELGFVSMLLYRLSDDTLIDDERDHFKKVLDKFLKKHLFMWVLGFCDKLEQTARSDYYKFWALILKNFIQHEMNNFNS